jgi:hypothetical protein
VQPQLLREMLLRFSKYCTSLTPVLKGVFMARQTLPFLYNNKDMPHLPSFLTFFGRIKKSDFFVIINNIWTWYWKIILSLIILLLLYPLIFPIIEFLIKFGAFCTVGKVVTPWVPLWTKSQQVVIVCVRV